MSTLLAALSVVALLAAVTATYLTVGRSTDGRGTFAGDARAAGTLAAVRRRASVACPQCDAENDVTTVYCTRCRARLAPDWLTEW
ncbi:hypothetical protein [Halomarina ordinaria]|uniref:Zinc ribbon domain-containing protein n=1 Tax=Halomarina ordinaria TaxID=3033939 RepID=A0ABD5UBT7_9EURY|nr:hypothetical protein [Halomarina sp. PSRA2]